MSLQLNYIVTFHWNAFIIRLKDSSTSIDSDKLGQKQADFTTHLVYTYVADLSSVGILRVAVSFCNFCTRGTGAWAIELVHHKLENLNRLLNVRTGI